MIKLVEDLVVNETSEASVQPTDREQGSETCLVVDGMVHRWNGSGTGIDGSREWQDLQRICYILHHTH